MEKDSFADATPAVTNALPPFAALLREFRASAELTQEELAERSGVSVRAISDLERGAKLRPQRATVRLLCDGLRLSADQRAALESAVPSRHRSRERTAPAFDLPVGGFLGSVPEGALVMRAPETEQIRAAVASVGNGPGRLLLFAGEPGVGKTRLAQEATLICRASGMQLVTGHCYETHQSVAFYPFVEIVSRLVTIARSRVGSDPLERWPALRTLVPDDPLNAGQERTWSGAGADQQHLFWAVSGLLHMLSETMPLVLAIDDLHWADRSSLALLQHLAHQLKATSMLLLGTYRDVEVGTRHPLRRVLRDLHREHLSLEIEVGRLSQAGTAALMSSTLGRHDVALDFVELVHRFTDGNAFFVQEVVRTLSERGDVVFSDGKWGCRAVGDIGIPRTVYEAIGERISRLTERTQDVLQEASVLSDTFEFDELQSMGDRSEQEIEDALDEAEQANVVRLDKRDTYSFNHALIQQVLYHDIGPRRRRRLHLAAGRALERHPGRLREGRTAELFRHFFEGGARDRALPYAVQTGDQATARFAHREAERYYRIALEIARHNRDSPLEALILEKLGRELTNVGRYHDARLVLVKAGQLYRGIPDEAGEVRVTVQLGSVYRATGNSQAAIDLIQGLLERIESGGRPSDIAELCIVLETLDFATGRYGDGLRVAERATEIARASGDMAALARAETGRGTELIALGNLDEGLLVLEAAIALPNAEDDPYNLVRALGNVAEGHRSRGNLVVSRDFAQESLDLGERMQSPWDSAIALACTGAAHRLLGDWKQARACFEQGERLIQSLSFAWWTTYVLLEYGALCLDEGNGHRASQLLNEGVKIARRSQHIEGMRLGSRLLAELDLLEGRPDSARARLESFVDRHGAEELQVTELLPTLAAAYEAGGELDRAESTVQQAIRRASACNAMLALATALIVRARILSSQENWDDAEPDLVQAIHLAQSMPYPLLEARGLLEWGGIDQRQGEIERAHTHMQQALTIFQRLGAQAFVDRAVRAIASLHAN